MNFPHRWSDGDDPSVIFECIVPYEIMSVDLNLPMITLERCVLGRVADVVCPDRCVTM